MKIGFIGQGFIGKHMADDFVTRGHDVVRYALEAAYRDNKDLIATCNVVFVAVPTPTTPTGFDSSILESALTLVGAGSIAVIKSTLLPGTTKRLQSQFPHITLFHSPEFLREKHADTDTRSPARTIIGMPKDIPEYQEAAKLVISVLPVSPYTLICDSNEAELIKYGGNCFLAMKVVFMNMMYEATEALGVDYAAVAGAMAADPRIGGSHMQVVDQSGHPGSKPGRGAGGHCFPKDLAAMRQWYEVVVPTDPHGATLWKSLEAKNNQLLIESEKDLDLLQGIYGDNVRVV